MLQFADRMKTAKTSAIVQVAEKVTAMKKAGRKVISFSIGVPNFKPAQHVYDAAHYAVDHDSGTYLPGRGSEELLDAFIKRMQEDHHLTFKREHLSTCIGGKHALFNIMFALLNRGDEVIMPSPYWTTYPDIVEIIGGKPVFMHCGAEQDYKLRPEQIAKAITPRTKVFMFNNPSNPTGMVYTADEVKALAEELKKHKDLWILSDDIYNRMIFDGEEFHHLLHFAPELQERMIVVHSVSKNYGMPGWRVGVIAAPLAMTEKLLTINSSQITNINNISMAAAAAAYGGPQDATETTMREFARKRDAVMQSLAKIPGVKCPYPKGAFYAFPNVAAYYGLKHDGVVMDNDITMCTHILEKKGLGMVPGSAFGEPEAMRISYACPMADLEEGMRLFSEFFAEMREQNKGAVNVA